MKFIYTFLERKCLEQPNKIFIETSTGKEISYSTFFNYLESISEITKSYFNKCNTKFCIALPNVPEFLYLLFGGIKNGGVAVNLNPDLSEDEFKFRLIDSEVSVIFIQIETYNRLSKLLNDLSIQVVIVGDDIQFESKSEENIDIIDFKLLLNQHHSNREHVQNVNGFFQYTGGTTGKTKAAVITQENVLESVSQMSHYLSPRLKNGEERFVVTFPFYHVFSIVFQVLMAIELNSTIILYPYPRDFKTLKEILIQQNFTVFVGVHTLYKMMLNDADIVKLKFPTTKLFVAGAEHIQPITKEKWLKNTGHYIIEGYGLTETSALASMSNLDIKMNDFDSIGIPLPGTQFKLLRDDGTEINSCNIPGEICIKGPQVVKGYWNRISENEISFSNGWLRTGDIGILKDNYQFKIVDRKKDVINVSGFNVYPNEVESVLMKFDDILDCAVVSISDKKSNERVAAFVVSNKIVDTQELINFCKSKLSAYKVPVKIYQIESIPKSPVGKTLRVELRNLLNQSN